MLTKKDVQIISEAMKEVLHDALKKERVFTISEFAKIDTRFQKLEEKIGKMPTKDEFYDKWTMSLQNYKRYGMNRRQVKEESLN